MWSEDAPGTHYANALQTDTGRNPGTQMLRREKAREGIAVGGRRSWKITGLEGVSQPPESQGVSRDEESWSCSRDTMGKTARKVHACPPHRPTAMYEYERRRANKVSRQIAPRMACTCKCSTYFITMRKRFIFGVNRHAWGFARYGATRETSKAIQWHETCRSGSVHVVQWLGTAGSSPVTLPAVVCLCMGRTKGSITNV